MEAWLYGHAVFVTESVARQDFYAFGDIENL
jgi:hypothetical protein